MDACAAHSKLLLRGYCVLPTCVSVDGSAPGACSYCQGVHYSHAGLEANTPRAFGDVMAGCGISRAADYIWSDVLTSVTLPAAYSPLIAESFLTDEYIDSLSIAYVSTYLLRSAAHLQVALRAPNPLSIPSSHTTSKLPTPGVSRQPSGPLPPAAIAALMAAGPGTVTSAPLPADIAVAAAAEIAAEGAAESVARVVAAAEAAIAATAPVQ